MAEVISVKDRKEMETFSLMGLKVNNVSMEETLEHIDNLIKSGGSHLVVTLGVEMVMWAQNDEDFRNIVNSASLVTPDSSGILWASKKAGHPLKERVPGVEIIEAAAKNADRFPWRTFLLGAKPGVAKLAGERLKEKYASFNLVGVYHGYFKDDDEAIEKIRDAAPQLIFVAMGFPAQEKWFWRNKERLGNIVAVGVGGSFDVLSGNIKRAPAIFRKFGVEWLYRLLKEPRRIKRMAVLPKFVLRVILKGV